MIARGTGYIRGSKSAARDRLVAHLRYIGRASATAGSAAFSSESDNAGRQEAVDMIMEHARSGRVRYHKIVLSPGGKEIVHDWQAWTRAIMADLSAHLQMNLYWYANLHTNTDHPHIHLVLAGSGERFDGSQGLVRLDIGAYHVLQKSGHAHSDHDWQTWLSSHTAEEARQWDTRKPFLTMLPGEGVVGTYKELVKGGTENDNLTPHHLPCAALMMKNGAKYGDCVAINVEQLGVGGRHRVTRSFGKQAERTTNETPRDALARDAWDLWRIYWTQGFDIKPQIQQAIADNLSKFPELFQLPPGNEGDELSATEAAFASNQYLTVDF